MEKDVINAYEQISKVNLTDNINHLMRGVANLQPPFEYWITLFQFYYGEDFQRHMRCRPCYYEVWGHVLREVKKHYESA